MEELILELWRNKINFKVEYGEVHVGPDIDTGFYGYVESIIEQNEDGTFTFEHGFRGYPYSNDFETVKDFIDWIKDKV